MQLPSRTIDSASAGHSDDLRRRGTSRMLDGPAAAQTALEWTLAPWRTFLLLPLVLALLALGISLLIPNKYRAVAQVYPEQQKASGAASLGGIAGLASQIGVGLATGAQSPQFYLQVLASRRIMEEVLSARVSRDGGDSATVRAYLVGGNSDDVARLDKALQKLREATESTVNARTNIIELAVTLKDKRVTTQVVSLYLDALSRFNLASRQTQAGQRRRFTESRLKEAQDSLTLVDRAISDFLTRNRQYRDSPTLSFEYERLQRLVSNYQTLYTGIRRDYDTARLDEVNDTPVLTLVDPPRTPLRKSSPSRFLATLGGGVLGAVMALFWAATRTFLARMHQEDRAQFDAIVAIFRRQRFVMRNAD